MSTCFPKQLILSENGSGRSKAVVSFNILAIRHNDSFTLAHLGSASNSDLDCKPNSYIAMCRTFLTFFLYSETHNMVPET